MWSLSASVEHVVKGVHWNKCCGWIFNNSCINMGPFITLAPMGVWKMICIINPLIDLAFQLTGGKSNFSHGTGDLCGARGSWIFVCLGEFLFDFLKRFFPFIWKSYRKRRENNFHLPIHFSDGYNGQDWIRTKLGASFRSPRWIQGHKHLCNLLLLSPGHE